MNALSFIANTQYIGEYDVPFPLVASLITFLHSKLRNYVLPSPAVWLGHVFEKISALSNALKCVVTCSWSDIGWYKKNLGLKDWNSWQECLLSNQHSPSIQNPNTKKALTLNIHKAFVWFWVRDSKGDNPEPKAWMTRDHEFLVMATLHGLEWRLQGHCAGRRVLFCASGMKAGTLEEADAILCECSDFILSGQYLLPAH